MAKELKDLTKDERLRRHALVAGLRTVYETLDACCTSNEAVVHFTVPELAAMMVARDAVLPIILALRARG